MVVDLRSDTVTKPSASMRQVMANAEVGDDIYGEDPTVNELQSYAAKLFDKEAALFVTSGTQGNTIAVLSQTEPGNEVLVEENCHIFWYEGAAAAALAGVQLHPVPGNKGILKPDDILSRVRTKNVHFPPSRLLCIENTHNRAGGTCWSLDEVKAVSAAAHSKGLKVHMDGARIFNAAIARGVPVASYAKEVDSVQFCLSKGLGAPIGSMLVGSADFIDKAKHWRKRLGGAMRQAGIIAAAGLYALKNNVDRLDKDHAIAKKLAFGLKNMGLDVDPAKTETNMVMLRYKAADELLVKLKEYNILAGLSTPGVIRFVTHLDVSEKDIDYVLETIQKLV